LYKEDFNRFSELLNETIDHVKTELIPDYDFDEFNRRDEERPSSNKPEAKPAPTDKKEQEDSKEKEEEPITAETESNTEEEKKEEGDKKNDDVLDW